MAKAFQEAYESAKKINAGDVALGDKLVAEAVEAAAAAQAAAATQPPTGAAAGGAGGSTVASAAAVTKPGAGELGPTDAADAMSKLAQSEAEARAAAVSGVTYNLKLSFGREDEYQGACTVKFARAAGASGDTFLDFTGRVIHTLKVNGVDSIGKEGVTWARHRVSLPEALLKDGDNVVEVTYTNGYDHTGAGLHVFTDPEDGSKYMYSNLEPFDAHRFLPCFDQPDLKARLSLTVDAPTEWIVIANDKLKGGGATPGGDGAGGAKAGFRRWEFEQTQPISTYLFAVCAGPYARVDDVSEAGVPLAIYCRQSLSKHLDADKLFRITKQGLAFYADFFACPYPFSKYDQLFVPEFNEGAMENPGAVTFTESYVFRETKTRAEHLSRCDTVLHEMAHMWFGDLVTMSWWDGLWLNESFATYMAALCTSEATEYGQEAWVQFLSGMKAWAMREDQMPTTHSIQPESVPDTEATFANFDGVTYGKGASVLKQLVAVLGMEAFRNGMRLYFERHAWGNTRLVDFLAALQERAPEGVDLSAWSDSWLVKAGPNELQAVYELEGAGTPEARIVSFAIEQAAVLEAHPTLRQHTINVALVDATGKVLTSERVVVEAQAVTPVPALAGKAMPGVAAAILNEGDHAFAKLSLDDRTLAVAREHLSPAGIEEPLTRRLLWSALYDMTRDARLSAQRFLAIARPNICAETDGELVRSVMRNVQAALGSLLPDAFFVPEAKKWFAVALEQMRAASSDDARLLWARFLLFSARDAEDVASLAKLVDEGTGVDGFELDQSIRWGVAQRCAEFGVGDVSARLAAEKERDPSDRGTREAETVKSAVPDPAVKAVTWARFEEAKEGESVHMLGAAMAGFHRRSQRDLTKEYVAKWHASLLDVFRTRTKQFAQAYFFHLQPPLDDDGEELARLKATLASVGEDDSLTILKRMLREEIDQFERCLRCRRLALAEA